MDDAPTSGSANLVTSGGVYDAINTATQYVPTSAGTAGQVWTSNGEGAGSWQEPAGGSKITEFTTYAELVSLLANAKHGDKVSMRAHSTNTSIYITDFIYLSDSSDSVGGPWLYGHGYAKIGANATSYVNVISLVVNQYRLYINYYNYNEVTSQQTYVSGDFIEINDTPPAIFTSV